MAKLDKISRAKLFESCYNQMSHELTQKATKIKATYTWDDIVMSPDQRQSLEYACDQMRYRKQVYEEWDYNRKYPYGRVSPCCSSARRAPANPCAPRSSQTP
jgi:hypothetical protein